MVFCYVYENPLSVPRIFKESSFLAANQVLVLEYCQNKASSRFRGLHIIGGVS